MSDFRTAHRIPHRVSCRALGVSESWFHKHRTCRPTRREVRRRQLAEAVQEEFTDSGGTYGSPKIWIRLVRQGWRVSVNTVAKLMAELGLIARKVRRRLRRRRGLTRSGKRPATPDFVNRDPGHRHDRTRPRSLRDRHHGGHVRHRLGLPLRHGGLLRRDRAGLADSRSGEDLTHALPGDQPFLPVRFRLREFGQHPVRLLPQPLHALPRGQFPLLQQTDDRRHPGTSPTRQPDGPSMSRRPRHRA
ncbi:IS3 family transposase [Streptomyces sp. NPDC096046]|uniref:IS3 family transposase n=1 Tax=Streptomyces sp. NPDC096046 TaxID=3155542 RepID=UPI00331AFA39